MITTNQLDTLLSYSDETRQKFQMYKEEYEQNYGVLPDVFQTQATATKRKPISKMNILKLGTDFEVKILRSEVNIETGYDSERNLNYYKLYFDKT